jgi:hypothetical protein
LRTVPGSLDGMAQSNAERSAAFRERQKAQRAGLDALKATLADHDTRAIATFRRMAAELAALRSAAPVATCGRCGAGLVCPCCAVFPDTCRHQA